MMRKNIVLVFEILLFVSTCYAGYEIDASAFSSGRVSQSTGTFEVFSSFNNFFGIEKASSSGKSFYKGFLGSFLWDGYLPAVVFKNFPETYSGVVHPDAQLLVRFSKPMQAETVTEAIKSMELRDNLGNPVYNEVQGLAQYEYNENELLFAPEEQYKKNYTYQLQISTVVRDIEGYFLPSPISFFFSVIVDHLVDNKIFIAREILSPEATAIVSLQKDTFSGDYYVVGSTDPVNSPLLIPSGKIQKANQTMLHNYGVSARIYSAVELAFFDGNGEILSLSGKGNLSARFKYESEGGLVQNLSFPVKEERLALFYLNEKTSNWVRMPGARQDKNSKTIECEFSASMNFPALLAVMALPDYDLTMAHAYPVPWIPNDGKPETGNRSDGITFTDLSSRGTIEIFTVSGEKVSELNFNEADMAKITWNGKNASGKTVASGAYIYLIKNERQKKTGKLVVIK